jgi:hypothetical protein
MITLRVVGTISCVAVEEDDDDRLGELLRSCWCSRKRETTVIAALRSSYRSNDSDCESRTGMTSITPRSNPDLTVARIP